MANPLKAAREELRALQETLQKTQQRIADLEAFIRVAHTLGSTDGEPKRVRARSEDNQIICDAVEKILSSSAPSSTRNLVADLKTNGHDITEQRLSQILSREKERFKASRKEGWTLKKAEANGAVTPSASIVRFNR